MMKVLSRRRRPQPSGNESLKTPYNPSKGSLGHLLISVLNGNFKGDKFNPDDLKLEL